jgi:hypothetical protein
MDLSSIRSSGTPNSTYDCSFLYTKFNNMSIPDYLVIGTITKDLIAGGFTLGGTVTYAAVTASKLGKRAAIVTSAEADLALPDTLADVEIVCAPSQATTTFRNIYVDGVREQYISALVHLGPLVGEIDESLVSLFPNSRAIATAQGWFRTWDETGHVSLGEWAGAEQLLPHLAALILGEEDICGDPWCIERYVSSTRTVVLTHGAQGATVYHAGQVRHLPTRPAREVDLTGAGDVFASAFLVRLDETKTPGKQPVLPMPLRPFPWKDRAYLRFPAGNRWMNT